MPGRERRASLESGQRLRASYDGTYEYIGVLAPDGTLLDVASLFYRSGRGRGLMLARALVDHLEISTTGAGTTVHLTRRTTTP
jgi:hypothetical protein